MPALPSQPIPNSAAREGSSASPAWLWTVRVAALLACVAGLALVVTHFGRESNQPLVSPALKAARDKLRDDPANEALKVQIRDLDLAVRKAHFRQLLQMQTGGWLLLGAGVVLVTSLTLNSRRAVPVLTPADAADRQAKARKAGAAARWAVAGCGAGVVALLLLPLLGDTRLISRPSTAATTQPGDAAIEVVNLPTAAEYGQNWPRFRGPGGGGVSPFTNLLASWDAATGAGIAWKTAVLAPGFNSPIIWGDRVLFSGGDAAKREVFCYALGTGALLWRQAVESPPGSPARAADIPDSTGYCAPTMATDGRFVYVIFANGDLAALTLEGKVAWTKNFGALKNAYGHATSLCTWRDRLIVQLDQGEAEEGKSKLYAIEGQTGRVLWQRPRQVGASWASPIVIEAAGKVQVITLALPLVIAYSAEDGSELWRVDCLNGEITPSPVFHGGLVYITSPSDKLVAIRPDGRGDVTKTNIVWMAEDNVPDVPSPVAAGEFVFQLTTSGVLTAFAAGTGKKLWEHDFEMEFHASPVFAGGRLYLFSQKGGAFAVEAGGEFKELFRCQMPDAFHASPALVSGRMVLRGLTNLWCLGAGSQPLAGKEEHAGSH